MKGERIFGFSFIKLLKTDGTVTRDGSYELFIYKVGHPFFCLVWIVKNTKF